MFTLVEGTLVSNLKLNSDGSLTGTPQWGGQYALTVRATDSSTPAQIATASFLLTLRSAPVVIINTGNLTTGKVNAWGIGFLTAQNGTAPYTFTVVSGALPPGVTLQSWGTMQGLPTQWGTFNFTVMATDANGLTGTANCSVSVAGPTMTYAPAPPDGRVGVPYSVTLTVSGGSPPYRFDLENPGAATWYTLTPQGVFSGTPTTEGRSSVMFRITDSTGWSMQFVLDPRILAPFRIMPETLPDGQVNVAYEQTLELEGSTNGATMRISSGTLPTGLSFRSESGSGRYYSILGTPTRTGTYTFTLSAQDPSGPTATQGYTVRVLEAAQVPLSVVPETVPTGRVGESYSVNIYSQDARTPITVTVASGSLPPGLTLATTGTLSGVPTSAGTYAFRAQVRDADNRTGTRDYTVRVFSEPLTVLPAAMPAAAVGTDFSVTISGTGGTPPYSVTPLAFGVPGLTWNSETSTYSGRPTAAGTYSPAFQVTDSLGNTGRRTYSLTVTGAVITIQPTTLPAARWGVAYSVQFTASGGVAPYRFTSSDVPLGLTLSTSGLLSGMPASSVSRTYEFRLNVTDSSGGAAYPTLSIAYTAPAFTLTPATLPDGIEGQSYSKTVYAGGAAVPVKFVITSGALPPGLSLEAGTDRVEIKGTPSASGTYPFRLTATDSEGKSVSLDYQIVVAGQPVKISPETLPRAVVRAPYAAQLSASGGTAPYTFNIIAGSLPSGLRFSPSGAFSGTTYLANTISFRVLASDSQGLTGTRDYRLTIDPETITISPTSLPDGKIRTTYSATLTASGGTSPYTFSLQEGSLPPGLTLQAGGTLSGKPTRAGNFSFRIGARDANGASGSVYYTLIVAGDSLTIGPATLPGATLGVPYSAQLTATGGTPPYAFQQHSGILPGGLKINPEGTITGTPSGSEPGDRTFMLQATDANGSSAYREYTIRVTAAGALTLLPASLPSAAVAQQYSVWLEPTGGTRPYTVRLASGSLPPGITLDPEGHLLGTPTQAGTFRFTLELADADGDTCQRSYELVVSAAAITISPSSFDTAKVGVPFSVTLSASGGSSPYSFAVTSGTLPQGLQLASSGALSGTPQATCACRFTVTATDSGGSAASRSYLLNVVAVGIVVTPDALPTASLNASYSVVLNASGGTAPYTFAVESGPLPTGLSLSGDGVLSGTPSQSGSFPLVVKVQDSGGATGTQSYTLVVKAAAIQISPTSLPAAVAGTSYSVTFTATGGRSPYTFSVRPDTTLPAGMYLAGNGILSGVPTNAGIYRFTVVVRDAGVTTSSIDLTLEVSGVAIRLTPDRLPAATLAATYLATITADGGAAPYAFAISTGSLPRGLTLAGTGVLSGKPQDSGVFVFRMRATDKDGLTGDHDYELRIAAIELIPGPTLYGEVGSPFSLNFSASGGTMPYTFSLAGGSLPPGIELVLGQRLSGTPTAPGTYTFRVQARDVNNATGLQEYTMHVRGAGVTITTSSLPPVSVGDEYLAWFEAAGGSGGYTFRLANGSLPPGLTLSKFGVLSGVPDRQGEYSFQVEVRDGAGASGYGDFTVAISAEPLLSITTTWLPRARVGEAFHQELAASGGTPAYTWSVVEGGPPAGVQLDPSGDLRGTPSDPGPVRICVRVKDQRGQTATRVLVLEVAPAPGASNSLFFDRSAVVFHLEAGSAERSSSECVAVFSTEDAAEVSVSLSTPPSRWAELSATTTRTPGSVCLSAWATDLAPGLYRGEIRFQSASTQPPLTVLPVALNVEAPAPPQLKVVPGEIRVAAVRDMAPVERRLAVFNSGSGALPFTIDPPAAGWLAVVSAPEPAQPRIPAAVTLRIDPAGLAAGVYVETLVIRTDGAQKQVRVTLAVSTVQGLLALSQTELELTAWAGGSPAVAAVAVTNAGLTPLSPAASTLNAGGSAWLRHHLPASVLGAGETASLEVIADPSTLTPGRYVGQVQVSAPGASNSPAAVVVGLTVLSASSLLPPDAPRAALVLDSPAGSTAVAVNSGSAAGLAYSAVVYGPDSGWLTVAPASGVVPEDGGLNLTLEANTTGRPAGLLSATLAVGFANGDVRSIPVTLLVPAVSSRSATRAESRAAAAPDASGVVVRVLSPLPGFRATVGRPVTLRARVEDLGGRSSAVAGVIVRAGERGLTLAPEDDRLWSGTWIPETPAESMQLEFATAAGSLVAPSVFVDGLVTGAGTGDVRAAAAVHAATLRVQDAIVPGAWVSLFGDKLAAESQVASSGSLPEELSGVRVTLVGLPLRLYFVSPGQVNAVVPWGVAANTWQQLVVWRDGVPAVPLAVMVAETQPGVFTIGQQGTGQAAALLAGTARLAGAETPVAAGDVVELYSTGLGRVDNPPADGAPASLTTLGRTLAPVAATVGGLDAEVLFAGLTPGTVGLYQVNVRIPSGAPAGQAVEVVLTQGGVKSNPVTVAVR